MSDAPAIPRSIRARLWRRRRLIFALLLLAILAVNALAFIQARAMTHFVAGGLRTERPEALSKLQKAKLLLTGITVPRSVNRSTPADEGMPFDICVFPSTDGIRLEAWHVKAEQSKGIIITFHGYSASKESQLPEARVFHDLGYDVLLVDFRGSGGSTGDETTVGVREADDVAAAVSYARNELHAQRVILFGSSMGAAAILRSIAVDSVQPDAIVLECPFDHLLSTVENRFHSMHLPSFPMARLLIFWGGVRQGYWGFADNPIDYAASVRCPVLFMQGKEDPRVTVPQAQSIYERLQCPKRFVLFEGVGHLAYLSREPQRWREAVGEFLSGLR